jgi:hypothetical protein
MADTQSISNQRLGLPEDLRAWVSDDVLVSLVFEAVHTTGWGEAASRSPAPLPPGRPRVLLTLLTYSYAIGLYGSDEIENRIPIDPQLLYLSAREDIPSYDLRHFRRYHRAPLQQTLSMVFQLLCEARDQAPAARFGVDLSALCASAAERRINEAVLRDTMALDT